MASTIAALGRIGILEAKRLTDEDIAEIEKLKQVAGEVLENYEKLIRA